jgi:hypothetical protein
MSALAACGLVVALGAVSSQADDIDPYLGNWALTTPGGGPGWLGITKEKGYYDATLLWEGGSVFPLDSVFMREGVLNVLRLHEVQRKDANGKVVRTQRYPELIMAKVDGDLLELQTIRIHQDGTGVDSRPFTGKRIPALPARPNLDQVKYGEPIQLLNGKDLTGWKLTNPNQVNGWSIENGVLINRPVQEEGKPHKSYGNLRTENEFEDFKLTLETRVEKRGNSGIYLRGIYEVQVTESYGQNLDSHNMGAVYSRITPTVSAEKPAGEWQSMDITLVQRHVTVVLNGKKIIDNQPLLGCTGGALWSDEFRTGPLYLQGDHTGVEYRNLVIRPVLKP